jgi:hypothetical protein
VQAIGPCRRRSCKQAVQLVRLLAGNPVCAVLLLWFCAVAAYNPYILGAACIFFCLLLVPFSLGQFRLVVVLGLLTFASVVLCQYAGCCGAVGSVTYLVGRILATGG